MPSSPSHSYSLQIEDMAMINAKEAQQYVYSMFIDGMLSLEVNTLTRATEIF